MCAYAFYAASERLQLLLLRTILNPPSDMVVDPPTHTWPPLPP
jgi:hypothetical protein